MKDSFIFRFHVKSPLFIVFHTVFDAIIELLSTQEKQIYNKDTIAFFLTLYSFEVLEVTGTRTFTLNKTNRNI
jgi:hypothetical protein